MRKASSISALQFLGLVRGPKSSSRFNVIRSYCDRTVSHSRKLPGLLFFLSLKTLNSITIYAFWYKLCASGPLTQYKSLVEQGKLLHDPNQEAVASQLDKLLGRLEQYEKDMEEYHVRILQFPAQFEALRIQSLNLFLQTFADKPHELGEEEREWAAQDFDGGSWE